MSNESYPDFDDENIDPHMPCIAWFPTSKLRMYAQESPGCETKFALQQIWQTKPTIGPVMSSADLRGPAVMIPDNPNLSEWRGVPYIVEQADWPEVPGDS